MAKIQLSFKSLNEGHPASSYYKNKHGRITTQELSEILEGKYDLIQTFIEIHKKDLNSILAKYLFYSELHPEMKEKSYLDMETKIKFLFREYLLNEEHEYTSVRAMERGDTTFIDTGAYLEALHIEIER